MIRYLPRTLLALVIIALLGACSDDDENVSTEAEARHAYMGLDRAVGLAMDLGFDGFNAASSANISAQKGDGEVSGTMTVTGKVDQGASNNKGMRLEIALIDYADESPSKELEAVTYNTSSNATLNLNLKKIPDGTLDGELAGSFSMSGSLEGDVTLQLTMSGALEAAGEGTERKPGSTRIAGTATSPYGTFDVDLTR